MPAQLERKRRTTLSLFSKGDEVRRICCGCVPSEWWGGVCGHVSIPGALVHHVANNLPGRSTNVLSFSFWPTAISVESSLVEPVEPCLQGDLWVDYGQRPGLYVFQVGPIRMPSICFRRTWNLLDPWSLWRRSFFVVHCGRIFHMSASHVQARDNSLALGHAMTARRTLNKNFPRATFQTWSPRLTCDGACQLPKVSIVVNRSEAHSHHWKHHSCSLTSKYLRLLQQQFWCFSLFASCVRGR